MDSKLLRESPRVEDEWPPLLRALAWDVRGDWKRAHDIAQDIAGTDASWVHAYLHRKEGDIDNAAYWYLRAKRGSFTGSLEEEWEALVRSLILQNLSKKM